MLNLKFSDHNLIKYIKEGKIGIIPTDTLYGLSCSIATKHSIEDIYRMKKRAINKPLIILVGNYIDLQAITKKLSSQQLSILKKNWPGRISFVLPVKQKYKYLHRGLNSLAFRMPAKTNLLKLLSKTGPLISTSVNIEGKKPLTDIRSIKKEFYNDIDFYINDGVRDFINSTLVSLLKKEALVLRKGIQKLNE